MIAELLGRNKSGVSAFVDGATGSLALVLVFPSTLLYYSTQTLSINKSDGSSSTIFSISPSCPRIHI